MCIYTVVHLQFSSCMLPLASAVTMALDCMVCWQKLVAEHIGVELVSVGYVSMLSVSVSAMH